jgi:hypothetical protein
MSLSPTIANPFRSNRLKISPISPRWTPSGLISAKVRSWVSVPAGGTMRQLSDATPHAEPAHTRQTNTSNKNKNIPPFAKTFYHCFFTDECDSADFFGPFFAIPFEVRNVGVHGYSRWVLACVCAWHFVVV